MAPADFARLVRSRRTSLLLDVHREVPRELVHELVELLAWAPNHRRTWPWQVAWLTGAGRNRLGRAAADAMAARGDDPVKVDKTRTKYLRAPGVLVVGADLDDSPLRTMENRDSVSAGIENLLLGATAHGLASFWSSSPKGADSAVVEVCEFPERTAIVAIIYLGWPTGTVEAPVRPPVEVRQIDH